MGSKTSVRGVKRLGEGRYEVRVYLHDPKTGRERQLIRIVEAQSVAEAAEHRAEIRRNALEAAVGPERLRLSAFAQSWLRAKLPSLKPSTAKTYAEVLDLHILPTLGDHFVDAIAHDDLVDWRDAQRGAAASINCRLRVLRTVLRDATVDLHLERDPTIRLAGVRKPEPIGDEENERMSLTADELRRVLEALRATHEKQLECERRNDGRDGLTWYPLVATLAFTGLRFGEATALRWTDIDEKAGSIRVRRAQWHKQLAAPKTKTSRRTVALAPELAEILTAHRRRMVADQVKGVGSGYVFPGSKGGLLFSSCLTKPVRAALRASGVERPFHAAHGWRHTFNDLVRRVAEGEVVRALTGHATEEMTEHYSHVGLDEKRAAVASVVRLVIG